MVDHAGELVSEVATLRSAARNEPLYDKGGWDHNLDVNRAQLADHLHVGSFGP